MRKLFCNCVKVCRNTSLVLLFLFLLFVYNTKTRQNDIVSKVIIQSGMQNIFRSDNVSIEKNRSEIENAILNYNNEQTIMNEEVYGPLNKDTVFLVISVHKSSLAFKFMLLSLSQVKGIEDTLVIFTHSYYDENINSIIKSIEFCRVLQIFYPYSLQVRPDVFPGFEQGDCPSHYSIQKAERTNCSSAAHYDIHGRYRNPELAEKKHHWWWTANQVFENLKCTEGHTGFVVFLRHYYYLTQDFLYMAVTMKMIAATLPRCEFLSLSTSTLSFGKDKELHEVEVLSYDPDLHSGVLAFDLPVWNSIVSHYDLFCSVDDDSWAQSLSFVSLNRKDAGPYRVMSSTYPRAYESESCVYFGKKLECDAYTSVYQILYVQKQNNATAFPPYIAVYNNIELEDEYQGFDYVSSRGGWNDPRDQGLCANITINKIKRELLAMNNQFNDADY